MCRLIKEINAKGESEQKVYGVLTDYDLSSWKEDLENCSDGTSQQRAGTPPYMAYELLLGRSTTHLYRHDLESLLYIMLTICGRHTFGLVDGGAGKEAKRQVVMRNGNLPYQQWFNTQGCDTLGHHKFSFFLNYDPIELSSHFEAFRPWLEDLRYDFSKGFKDKLLKDRMQPPLQGRKRAGGSADGFTPAPVPFDDETLNGRADYFTVIEPTKFLKGDLEGLIIRYETTSPPLPTPAGAVQADARIDP